MKRANKRLKINLNFIKIWKYNGSANTNWYWTIKNVKNLGRASAGGKERYFEGFALMTVNDNDLLSETTWCV